MPGRRTSSASTFSTGFSLSATSAAFSSGLAAAADIGAALSFRRGAKSSGTPEVGKVRRRRRKKKNSGGTELFRS